MLELTLVDEGDILYEQDTTATQMFFLTDGEVEVWCHTNEIQTKARTVLPNTPFSYFGQRACLREGLHRETAIAKVKSLVYALSHDDLRGLSTLFPDDISALKEMFVDDINRQPVMEKA